MGALLSSSFTSLNEIICAQCGVLFAMPSAMFKSRCEDSETFFCPSGHNQHFPKNGSETVRLKKELARELQRREMAEREAKMLGIELTKAEAKTERVKADRKRLLKRIKNGVCPCCNRTFSDLQRHMTTKHPEISK